MSAPLSLRAQTGLTARGPSSAERSHRRELAGTALRSQSSRAPRRQAALPAPRAAGNEQGFPRAHTVSERAALRRCIEGHSRLSLATFFPARMWIHFSSTHSSRLRRRPPCRIGSSRGLRRSGLLGTVRRRHARAASSRPRQKHPTVSLSVASMAWPQPPRGATRQSPDVSVAPREPRERPAGAGVDNGRKYVGGATAAARTARSGTGPRH